MPCTFTVFINNRLAICGQIPNVLNNSTGAYIILMVPLTKSFEDEKISWISWL